MARLIARTPRRDPIYEDSSLDLLSYLSLSRALSLTMQHNGHRFALRCRQECPDSMSQVAGSALMSKVASLTRPRFHNSPYKAHITPPLSIFTYSFLNLEPERTWKFPQAPEKARLYSHNSNQSHDGTNTDVTSTAISNNMFHTEIPSKWTPLPPHHPTSNLEYPALLPYRGG